MISLLWKYLRLYERILHACILKISHWTSFLQIFFRTLCHPPDDFTWVLFSKARLDVETSYGHKHAWGLLQNVNCCSGHKVNMYTLKRANCVSVYKQVRRFPYLPLSSFATISHNNDSPLISQGKNKSDKLYSEIHGQVYWLPGSSDKAICS